MASRNFVQPVIPRFDGHYDHWGMLMENFLRSKEYWQAIDPSILETILCKDTSKQIWDSMKKKYEGSAKAKRQQLQTLRTKFENLKMKSGESIAFYFSRVMAITNKMRVFGDKLEDIIIIEKILRSLTPKFNFVVCAIEESKNIDELSLDELQSSLLNVEAEVKRREATTNGTCSSSISEIVNLEEEEEDGDEESSGVQKSCWLEAVNWSIHVLNRSPTFSVQNQTPEEAWAKRSKLDDKGEKCIFLGVCEQSKAYKLYNPITKKIVISRDVVFNEAEYWSHDECKREQRIHVDFEDKDEETRQQVETNDEQIVPEEIPVVGAVERAQRVKKRPAWMQDYVITGIDQYDDPVVHFALFSDCDPLGKDGKMLIVCLYVDDLFYIGNDDAMFEKFKQSMMLEFDMFDLGKMHYFLGIEVRQSSDGIFISQRKYVQDVLMRFQMNECNSVSTPVEFGLKLHKDQEGKKVDITLYKQIVGSLMYLTTTRPDIMHSDGTIDVFYCKSEDQIADIMTKSLKLSMFQKLRKLMGVCSFNDSN
ncbi:hypothetical protein HRI_005155700 [Hibiscus trionum]|uniref:Reverse transcriptase Ty1/copia-type domain-containing protein n=1 Tax=Hibiscus trionum TaxID=183268 RepID=A0A9W7JJD3_HIBTR|nr:hypothetical protein HRI_005155700 [Hibiscus trionum]